MRGHPGCFTFCGKGGRKKQWGIRATMKDIEGEIEEAEKYKYVEFMRSAYPGIEGEVKYKL